jgi:hypothetical protein
VLNNQMLAQAAHGSSAWVLDACAACPGSVSVLGFILCVCRKHVCEGLIVTGMPWFNQLERALGRWLEEMLFCCYG